MKKVIIFLICFQILSLPVFAQYDFSDEAQAEFERQRYQQIHPVDFSKKNNRTEIKNNENDYTPVQQELINNTYEQPHQQVINGYVVKIPAGTTFQITFDAGISSGSLEKNDRLTAKLTRDVVYNGTLIAPAGSLVYGSTTEAKNAGYAYGSGAFEINFDEILTPDGNLIGITTERIYMEAKSERAKKMTRDVVVGALGSMLVGAAFTALSGSDDWGRNMAVYGGMGALGGGIRGTMQRGKDIEIPDGTTIELKLLQPLSASPYNNLLQ